MIRKYLTLVLAICCGWPLIGQAATATTPAAPAISDVEVMRYLTKDEVPQWQEAAKKISDGQGEISDGKFMLSRTEDPNSIVKTDIADTHKKGADRVKEGTAMVKDGTATETKLRKLAMDRRDAAHQQAAATAAATFTAAIGQWPEASQTMPAKLLSQLSDEKYTRVYFGGVYSFEEPKYVAKPELAAKLHDQLMQNELGKKLLASVSAESIKLAQDNGRLVVDYPSRTTDAQNNTKAALIVGELLYQTNNGYAAFSLRAIDLSNLHVVASQLMILSVEPTMAKLMGLPAFRVMARRDQPPSAPVAAAATDANAPTPAPMAADAPAPVTAITVNLQDPNDTLAAFKKPPFVFRLATSGRATTFENRFIALIVKSYFHDVQPDVAISDQDFLTMALPASTDTDAAASPADVNTAWVLPNVADLNVPSIDLDSLTAHDLNKNASVKIGKLTIERTMPKLGLPSAAELRAAGYSG